jgi:hypothetical protein
MRRGERGEEGGRGGFIKGGGVGEWGVDVASVLLVVD